MIFVHGKELLTLTENLGKSVQDRNLPHTFLSGQPLEEYFCLRNDFGSKSRTFSETNNIVIPSFNKLLYILSFEVCFCRDILSAFCLVRLFTSASHGIRLKTLLVSRIRILSFCPLFNFLYVLNHAFLTSTQ